MAQTTDLTVQDSIRSELVQALDATQAVKALTAYGFALDDDKADGIRSVTIVDNKDSLLGVKFLILGWRFNDGDNGEFVSFELAKENDDTIYVVNDGSTGIYRQLRTLTAAREENGHPSPYAGRVVKHGLRKSEYQTEVNGKVISATTYYLAF